MSKKWMIVALVITLAGAAQAKSVRTALTKENRAPRLQQAEIGTEVTYSERDLADDIAVIPYMRYTLLRDFVVFGKLPYRTIDPDFGDRESGVGDASLGFELLAYKGLFGYPWIMPHAEVFFPTGDDDKGLGAGDMEYQFGLAMGATSNRDFHFAADARYRIVEDEDNIPSVAVSLVWELDRQFGFIGEIELARRKVRDEFGFRDDSHPITFMGGFYYAPTRDWLFTFHGGTVRHSDEDIVIRGKIAYSF